MDMCESSQIPPFFTLKGNKEKMDFDLIHHKSWIKTKDFEQFNSLCHLALFMYISIGVWLLQQNLIIHI